MRIMQSLPTNAVEQIVDGLRPRLCLDFIERLPTEVCLRIMSFLDPVSLIKMAITSRESKVLALDWKLWENLYYMEGWKTIPGEVESFQQELIASSLSIHLEHTRPESDDEGVPSSKKRATPQLVTSSQTSAEDATMSGMGNVMEPLFGGPILSHPDSFESTQSAPQIDQEMTSLVTRDCLTGKQSLNWRHLYTQRRRLEDNWEAGRYNNFQIPHPDHAYQAHSECIYTLQFQGRYLVSGSRDRSLRIWDIQSRQLVLPPLIGHTGSVLCLQFDADPSEDIIVSGSSDASIILWRFSTGKALQIFKHAHRESVLNVRFDHRILVTCSKDKLIKIFNRRHMRPGDEGYPKQQESPAIVINNYGVNPSPAADAILNPYTIIGTLDGHGAAVNAVQIWKNEIVSASGDRNVKIWDWPKERCTRTLVGHTKGIACVQYDGRRIVSGSSDNEIKVFDKVTGLEVASLLAHTLLVRTIQAGFADLPSSVEEDLEAAKKVDDRYFEAVEQGSVRNHRGRPRNAGSSRPEDIIAYGAALPPGGGGSQYKRIVSGSYDESVIIWRRDKDGAWKPSYTFRQEEATRAAARQTGPVRMPPSSKANGAALRNGSLPPTDPFFHYFIDRAIRAGPVALHQLLISWPALLESDRLRTAIENADEQIRPDLIKVYEMRRSPPQQQQQRMPIAVPHPPVPLPPQQAAQNLATAAAAIAANNHTGLGMGAAHQRERERAEVGVSRVFKLQYDARMIIACSQAPIIVGWDFANGDDMLIDACRFFGAVD